ncbi:adenylate/guanylate cyclase domain-containing protein [Nisaea sediminum]|uniref:adenylate/guanylate cyclase domain-containing protein n=1 Tax=Nisaea sediminum TaxID=2775867 RepID=UPI001867D164|nr:adenylate/guanylate cyclase domain-containing protein [Nisaea sediminum]
MTKKAWIRLRTALQGLLITSVVASVATVGVMLTDETAEVLEGLAEAHFTTVGHSVVDKVDRLLNRYANALTVIELVDSGTFAGPGGQQELETALLSKVLHLDPGTWVGYGSLTGAGYFLVTRNEHSAEMASDTIPHIHAAHQNNKPASREKGTAGHVYATSYKDAAWFKDGLKSPSPTWTKPYRFQDGKLGMSVLRAHGNPPAGVLHIDIPLEDLKAWMTRIKVGTTGAAFLMHRDGTVAVAPSLDEENRKILTDVFAGNREELQGLFARASSTEFISKTIRWDGLPYHVGAQAIPSSRNLEWFVAMIVPERDFLYLARERLLGTVAFGIGATIAVIIAAAYLATRISGPIRTISADISEAARMRLSDTPAPSSGIAELNILGRSVDQMKSGLRSLQRYVPPDLAADMVSSGEAASFGAVRKELTILFIDIEGFTGIAEGMAPDRLVLELRDFFDLMAEALHRSGGTIDKFMGDGLLAFYNAPRDLPDHAAAACAGALDALEALRQREGNTGVAEFRIRIGLGFGDVVVGNIGSSERFGYSIIGDAANVASRLESLNKMYGTRIIGPKALKTAAGDGFEWRHLDRVAVAGHKTPTDIYELLGRSGAVDADRLAARDLYERALRDYFAGEFTEAANGFASAGERLGADPAARMLRERSEQLAAAAPADWDGVFSYTTK